MHLKSYEIQPNRHMFTQAILPLIAFLGIDYINSLLLICRALGREMSQGLYINLQMFQPIFLSLCCCCCFAFLKQGRHFDFQSYGGVRHKAMDAFVEKHILIS